MKGNPVAKHSPLAKATPTTSAPTRPGPMVHATAERSSKPKPACSIVYMTVGTMASVCLREAISGTTPPKRL